MIDDGAAELPPDRFHQIPGDVRNFLATLGPDQIAALSDLRPHDVSTLRAGVRGFVRRESAMPGSSPDAGTTRLMNWLTAISTTLLLAIAGVGWNALGTLSKLDTQFSAHIEQDKQRWETHMTFHRERGTEIANDRAGVGARISSLETQGRQMDRHDLRIGQVEEGLRSTNQRIDAQQAQTNTTLAAMMEKLNSLVSDVRVLRADKEARQGNGSGPFLDLRTFPARTVQQAVDRW